MISLPKKLIFITFMAFSFQSMAANKSVQVIDKGQDGNTRYYTAACPNGNNGNVVVHFQETSKFEPSAETLKLTGPAGGTTPSTKPQVIKICASVGSKNEKCSASWDIQAAAKASCK